MDESQDVAKATQSYTEAFANPMVRADRCTVCILAACCGLNVSVLYICKSCMCVVAGKSLAWHVLL